jgi:fido (protein-threonine AMPylation protein)
MFRCSACRAFREIIGCDPCLEQGRCVGDTRLAELAHQHQRPLTWQRLIELRQSVENGLIVAQSQVFPGCARFPRTDAAFLAAIIDIHRTIFGRTGLPFAGRFRVQGEDAWVDRGTHEFQGADPAEIEPELRDVFVRIADCGEQESRHHLARKCALLFEFFFDVHPFCDGNGRVARLLARWLVIDTGKFDLMAFPKSRSGRMKYLNGLRYAHSRRRQEWNDGKLIRPDPSVFLTRWLETLVVEMDTQLEEHPPPWLEPGPPSGR